VNTAAPRGRLVGRARRPPYSRPCAGRQHDEALCMAPRERARRAVERGIRRPSAERARDPRVT